MADPKPNTAVTPTTATNNAVTTAAEAKKAYDLVVTSITDIYRVGQARAIQTMWAMGRVVDEFLGEVEKKEGSRYGTFGVDKLAEDLTARDVQGVARSSLYHARKVFKTLSFEQIETLAQRGYSVNHVKTLLPLDDEIRERVHARWFDPKTNQIIPVTKLQEKVKSMQMDAAKAAADKALEGPTQAEQIEAEADAGPANPQQTSEEAAKEMTTPRTVKPLPTPRVTPRLRPRMVRLIPSWPRWQPRAPRTTRFHLCRASRRWARRWRTSSLLYRPR